MPEVLIVGAGPAGLAAALELARHDVPCLVVERRSALSSHPRATVLSLRSMEIVRAWGLEAAVRARSLDVDWRMLEVETMAHAAAGTPLLVGYPSPEQSRMVSPTTPACVAQDEVEPLLLQRLAEIPGVRIELGTELTGIVADAGGAHAVLRDSRGETRTVAARFVIAADGARSAVREALGIELAGRENLMVGFTTLFRAPLWGVVGKHRHILYSVKHAEAPGTFLPAGHGGRWLFGLRRDEAPSAAEATELIRLGAGVPDLPVRVERSRWFSAAAQIAEQWRAGCVFLAGDAAHRVTPRGGTGLNLALHDGYDLGWRLGWVLRGWAGPELLDAYEAERRPVAEYTAARSADPQGSIRPPETEVRVDLGGRIPHVATDDGSTLDLLAPGLTLFTNGRPPALPCSRVPVTVRHVDPMTARALNAPVLARSDGVPVPLSGCKGVSGGASRATAQLRCPLRTPSPRLRVDQRGESVISR
jgi:putative polyketide hydroxylase